MTRLGYVQQYGYGPLYIQEEGNFPRDDQPEWVVRNPVGYVDSFTRGGKYWWRDGNLPVGIRVSFDDDGAGNAINVVNVEPLPPPPVQQRGGVIVRILRDAYGFPALDAYGRVQFVAAN